MTSSYKNKRFDNIVNKSNDINKKNEFTSYNRRNIISKNVGISPSKDLNKLNKTTHH